MLRNGHISIHQTNLTKDLLSLKYSIFHQIYVALKMKLIITVRSHKYLNGVRAQRVAVKPLSFFFILKNKFSITQREENNMTQKYCLDLVWLLKRDEHKWKNCPFAGKQELPH